MLVPYLALTLAQSRPPVALQDVFGRDLAKPGVTLIDWEGRIANPAIRLRLVPSEKLYLPARVKLTANHPRMMFNLWSEVSSTGPTKILYLDQKSKPVPFLMSIFPDTDGINDLATLKVEITDANESTTTLEFPVKVLDQDQPDRAIDFPIVTDFSQDRSGFFADPKAKELAETAAKDWAYFLEAPVFDPVPAGAETSFIYEPNGFERGQTVTNAQPYTGFLLYFVGVTGPEKRSGAVASDVGTSQMIKGRKTGLRRSGTVAMETTGNYNAKGWQFLAPDEAWWEAGNMSTMVADFFSIVHHEMGHSLVNHRVHPAYNAKIKEGRFVDPTLRRYSGNDEDPRILDVEHFFESIDSVSRVGAFGNEYGGDMPRKRWLITKFDLLVMQSIGYRLRETTPFERLSFDVPTAPVRLAVGEAVDLDLSPSGGIPTYNVKVFDGKLPDGLTLDPWTGRITGTPKTLGDTSATVQLRDNDPTRLPISKSLKFSVLPVGQARG
ncbi:MAG: Ig domain-containing protein [Fimbriimonadaceae bacterium]|nr:Ig domain-containing protein [Fimbriimonadaceae bacterium]